MCQTSENKKKNEAGKQEINKSTNEQKIIDKCCLSVCIFYYFMSMILHCSQSFDETSAGFHFNSNTYNL
jgi:hypothetical protein